MTERDLTLVRSTNAHSVEISNSSESVRNRGRLHIQDAIAVLRGTDLTHRIEYVVETAEVVASAEVGSEPLQQILQILDDVRGDTHQRGVTTWGMAKVYALLGDYDAATKSVPDVIFPASALLYIAKTQIGRGQDPSQILHSSEQLVLNYDVKNPSTSKGNQALDFGRIGMLYAQAGMDERARAVFFLAEEIIDHARDQYREGYSYAMKLGKNHPDAEMMALRASDLKGHDMHYDRLASSFANSGWFEDALRVADKLKEDRSHYFSTAVGVIVEQQLQRQLAEDAVNTARKLGGPLYIKTLARAVVIQTEQGKPCKETVSVVENILEGDEKDQEYVAWESLQAAKSVEGANPFAVMHHLTLANTRLDFYDSLEVRRNLALTAAKDGDWQESSDQFYKIWIDILKTEDVLLNPAYLLDFAKSVDDAGFQSGALFQKTHQALQEMISPDEEPWWHEHGPDADFKWTLWAEAIRELADRKQFELAKDMLDSYAPFKGYDVSRAQLFAYLGRAEVNVAY